MTADLRDRQTRDQRNLDREKRALSDQAQWEGDLLWAMDAPQGRRLVWRLTEQASVFDSAYSPTAMHFALGEGRRSVGRELRRELSRLCPALLSAMDRENGA